MHQMASHHEISVGLPYARLLTKVFRKFIVNLNNELCYMKSEADSEISYDVSKPLHILMGKTRNHI